MQTTTRMLMMMDDIEKGAQAMDFSPDVIWGSDAPSV
jgi:hypothetical protein